MTAPVSFRGATPVATLTDLGAVEAAAIYYLRQWNNGQDAQSKVWNELATTLGVVHARKALKSFETLWSLCARHGRRPLLCHSVKCKCVGADESCFANFIGYAADGAREDAMLMAINMVRPDMAVILVGLAEEFGMALKRMTMSVDFKSEQPHTPAVLH